MSSSFRNGVSGKNSDFSSKLTKIGQEILQISHCARSTSCGEQHGYTAPGQTPGGEHDGSY